MKAELVLFFDGHCNLCNGSVQWVIKRDKSAAFLFAPLQGKSADRYLGETTSSSDLKTIFLFENGRIYDRSSAALRILYHLGWPYRLLYVFSIVPKIIRDWVYDYISKNRYKWFGKTKECMMPTEDLSSRFLM